MGIDLQENEKEWERVVLELAALYNWDYMHVHKAQKGKSGAWLTPTSKKGWPDLTLWHKDHGIIFVELKVDNKYLRPEQKEVINSLRQAGQHAEVWKPKHYDWVVKVLSMGPQLDIKSTSAKSDQT